MQSKLKRIKSDESATYIHTYIHTSNDSKRTEHRIQRIEHREQKQQPRMKKAFFKIVKGCFEKKTVHFKSEKHGY